MRPTVLFYVWHPRLAPFTPSGRASWLHVTVVVATDRDGIFEEGPAGIETGSATGMLIVLPRTRILLAANRTRRPSELSSCLPCWHDQRPPTSARCCTTGIQGMGKCGGEDNYCRHLQVCLLADRYLLAAQMRHQASRKQNVISWAPSSIGN